MRKNIVDHITVRGYTHERNGIECQDYSCSWQGSTYDAVVISDGHGGEKYIRSAIGSKFACEAAQNAIEDFMNYLASDSEFHQSFIRQEESNWRQEVLQQLKSAIIQGWNELVRGHLKQNPLQSDNRFEALQASDLKSLEKAPEKAYGATLIAVVLTDEFYLALKLGDGNVCVREKGQTDLVESPTLQDDSLQFNLTTSLCNNDALSSFKHGFFLIDSADSKPELVITTDGIINSYIRKEDYLDLISDIILAYHDQELEAAHNDLAEWLPELSEKGSGDDLSVALIVRKEDCKID